MNDKLDTAKKLYEKVLEAFEEFEEFIDENDINMGRLELPAGTYATYREVTEDDGIVQWYDDIIGTKRWMTSSDECA